MMIFKSFKSPGHIHSGGPANTNPIHMRKASDFHPANIEEFQLIPKMSGQKTPHNGNS